MQSSALSILRATALSVSLLSYGSFSPAQTNTTTKQLREQFELAEEAILKDPVQLSGLISRLEEIIASKSVPDVDEPKRLLAHIYSESGSYVKAGDLLADTSESVAASSVQRTIDSLGAYEAYSKSQGMPEKAIKYLDQFNRIYEQKDSHFQDAVRQGMIDKRVYDRSQFQLDRLKAEVWSSYAELYRKQADSDNQEEMNRIRRSALMQASEHMDLYLQRITSDPGYANHSAFLDHMNWGEEASLYRLGLINAGVAKTAIDLKDEEGARLWHQKAVSSLEHHLDKYPQATFSQNSATLLLNEVGFTLEDVHQLVEYADELLKKISPGHEVLSFLRSKGVQASGEEAKAAKAVAVDILGLTIKYEKHWFPTTYSNDVNFQWSVLVAVQDYLALGNFEAAKTLLAELDGVEIRGEFLQQLHNGDTQALVGFITGEANSGTVPQSSESIDVAVAALTSKPSDRAPKTESASTVHAIPVVAPTAAIPQKKDSKISRSLVVWVASGAVLAMLLWCAFRYRRTPGILQQ